MLSFERKPQARLLEVRRPVINIIMISEILVGILIAGFFTFVLIIAVFFFTKWLNEQSKPKPIEQRPADMPLVDAVNLTWDAAANIVSFSLHIDARWVEVVKLDLQKMMDNNYTRGGPSKHTGTYPISLVKDLKRPVSI